MTTLHPPTYIPGEICLTVGLEDTAPPDECMTLVKADVADDAVSAPADDVVALRGVVQEAVRDGIDLKIVVAERNPARDTALRDVATVIGSEDPDSTVLVLSPSYVGSYSGQFHRAKLESSEDSAKTGNPVVSAQNFLNGLNTPEFPWTAWTIVLLAAVAVAAVGARVLQKHSKLQKPAAPHPE